MFEQTREEDREHMLVTVKHNLNSKEMQDQYIEIPLMYVNDVLNAIREVAEKLREEYGLFGSE